MEGAQTWGSSGLTLELLQYREALAYRTAQQLQWGRATLFTARCSKQDPGAL